MLPHFHSIATAELSKLLSRRGAMSQPVVGLPVIRLAEARGRVSASQFFLCKDASLSISARVSRQSIICASSVRMVGADFLARYECQSDHLAFLFRPFNHPGRGCALTDFPSILLRATRSGTLAPGGGHHAEQSQKSLR